MSLIFLRCSQRFTGMGGNTIHMQNAYLYMCEILVDCVRSQVTELRDGRLFMFGDEAA